MEFWNTSEASMYPTAITTLTKFDIRCNRHQMQEKVVTNALLQVLLLVLIGRESWSNFLNWPNAQQRSDINK